VFSWLVGWLVTSRRRIWLILSASLLAVYWIQPSLPIRNLDFWLPTASILLTVFVWTATQSRQLNNERNNYISVILAFLLILLIGLTRYSSYLCCLTPSRPPDIFRILFVLVPGIGISALVYRSPKHRHLSTLTIGLILGIFILLKAEPLTISASSWLRSFSGQDSSLSSALDLSWLGYSYLAFRLIHVLRDHQTGRLPAYGLGEFVAYAIFYPSFTAGPIDRSQRFIKDLRGQKTIQMGEIFKNFWTTDMVVGAQRVIIGLFKKFVMADSLALLALNVNTASQTTSSFWMWVLLYAYALRIYFDFAGYTDVAIGLGRFVGIKLPENFNQPYLKENLTAFWNSWNITLAQWFRAYFFNPLTRALRSRKFTLPTWSIILVGQFSTMVLIGLWHGISINYFVWGAWHGLGLFTHNRWSEWVRPRLNWDTIHPLFKPTTRCFSCLLTFNYVTLGWVWFVIPDLYLAKEVFLKLFSI